MRRSPGEVVLLVALVVLAGCASAGSPAVPAPVAGDGVAATVVEVVDGDTVRVRLADGSTDTVRLLGVDTPEVHVANDPADYEGVPDTEAGALCLRVEGDDAGAFVERRVLGEPVQLLVDPSADRRDRYGRLLAYVHVDGADLNRQLVARGYARVYDSTFARSSDYYALEAAARAEGRGVWRCQSIDPETETAADDGPLRLVEVHADAAGDDRSNLNDEYVVLENAGDAPLDLSGWVLADAAGHAYVFPDGFALAPGNRVSVRTGAGRDTATALHWGAAGPVWNNDGDTVLVRAPNGTAVLERSYG